MHGARSAALFAGFALLFWPLIDPRTLIVGLDTITYQVPNAVVTLQALRHLRLPQWNQYLFAGAPQVASPQTSVFYPFKLLFGGLDPHRAIQLVIVVHLLFLGVGLLIFLRRCVGLSAPSVIVGVIAFIASGPVLANSVQVEQIMTIAWGPWLLVAADFTASRRLRATGGYALTAVVTGAMLLAGHPQPGYYLIFLAVCWALARAATIKDAKGAATVFAGLLGGVGIAAVQLFPTSLLVRISARPHGLSLAELGFRDWLLPLRGLPGRLVGDPINEIAQTASGRGVVAHLGVAVLLLAGLGLIAGFRSRDRRLIVLGLAVPGGIAALLAAGPQTPLFRVALVVPGMRFFRAPGKWFLVTDLALACLAALGVDAVLHRLTARVTLYAAGALILGAVVLFSVLPFELPKTRTLATWLLIAVFVVLAAWSTFRRGIRALAVLALVLIPALELGSLARFVAPWTTQRVPSSAANARGPIVAFLATHGERMLTLVNPQRFDSKYLLDGLRPNVNATLGIRSLDGYDGGPLVSRRWATTMSLIAGSPLSPGETLNDGARSKLDPVLLARFGVRWAIVDSDTFPASQYLSNWRGPVVRDGRLQVWDNPAYSGDAMVYRSATSMHGDVATGIERLAHFAAPTALTEYGPTIRCRQECTARQVQLHRSTPERFWFQTDESARSLLVVAEQWNPGWRVRVDGRSARPVPAEGFLMGVPLDSGPHRVDFSYETPGLMAGAAATVFSLLAACVAALSSRLQRLKMPFTRRVRKART